MKYVQIDSVTGVLNWDKYFEHLLRIQHQLPAALYKYAANWDHYSLEGANSLHDAWLVSAQFSYKEQEVILEFLGARHDRRHVLHYVGVKSYVFDLDVEYRFGDRDILAHEFRLDDGLLTHEILFSNNRHIIVKADIIVPEVGKSV